MLMPAEGSRTTCYIYLFFDTHTHNHIIYNLVKKLFKTKFHNNNTSRRVSLCTESIANEGYELMHFFPNSQIPSIIYLTYLHFQTSA